MTFYEDPLVTLLHGDCIEVMATLPADSVDAVVTDPPYGLEFMGKDWDRFAVGRGAKYKRGGEMITPEQIAERRGKGGAGPSYVSRPAIRCITCGKQAWSGSPCKCEKPEWREDNSPLLAFQAWCEQWGREALRVTKPGGYLLAFGGTRTHHRLVCALEDAGWIIRDELDWIYASGFPKGKANLKPAHEPIVLARKPGPLRPLAIDECRIDYTSEADRPTQEEWNRAGSSGAAGANGYAGQFSAGMKNAYAEGKIPVPSGRWPSNVLLGDPELFDEPNPYVVGSGATSDNTTPHLLRRGVTTGNGIGLGSTAEGYSRFFIVPKADRAERERGLAPERGATARANSHPTVKPIDLIRHLVRLVTPSGGTVLDPFLGSGTTCLAASELGVCSIGIEREAEYLDIAKDRLIATPMGLGLDDPLVGVPRVSRDGIAVQRNKTGEGYAASSYEIRQGPGPDMGYGVRRTVIDEPKAPGLFDDD